MAISQPAAAVLLVSTVVVTAASLALYQRRERGRRPGGLSDADTRHFALQDFRRAIVTVVLMLLALGIAVGSPLEHKPAGRPNPWFLAVWLAVFLLVVVLVWLALLDGIATWLYGRRHRRALTAARERLEELRDRLQRRSYGSNGEGKTHEPLDGDARS